MIAETLAKPMREQLTSIGFQELLDPGAVDTFLKNEGTTLVMINFFTGTAELARRGMALAMSHETLPDRFGTVFDEQEVEATARLRGYLAEYPPSRPSFALFKNGESAALVAEYQLNFRTPEDIATTLTKVFDEHCAG